MGQGVRPMKGGVMEDNKRIGWFCSYVPEELILAAGLVPIRLKGQVTKLKEVAWNNLPA